MRCSSCEKNIHFWGVNCPFCGHDKSADQSIRVLAGVVLGLGAFLVFKAGGLGAILMLASILIGLAALGGIARIVLHRRRPRTQRPQRPPRGAMPRILPQ